MKEQQFLHNQSALQVSSTYTLIWMIKYVQYLIITWVINSLESFYWHTRLFDTHHKIEDDGPHSRGGLQSFKVNVRPCSLYYLLTEFAFRTVRY